MKLDYWLCEPSLLSLCEVICNRQKEIFCTFIIFSIYHITIFVTIFFTKHPYVMCQSILTNRAYTEEGLVAFKNFCIVSWN